jgi:hypothetical protein
MVRLRARSKSGLVVLATAVGAAVEVILIAAGTYRFTSGTATDALPPPWLLVMWAQFATTFRFSLRSVVTRPVLAVTLGAAGGPIAFLAGERLGATLLPPLGRDVRVVEGARLESEAGHGHQATSKSVNAHAISDLTFSDYHVMCVCKPRCLSGFSG